MKKILTLLSMVTISISTASASVACLPAQAKINTTFDNLIGKDIDKSNAVDTSEDPANHFGVSNFYTLGDSLSDNGGLVTIAKDELGVDAKMSGEYKNGFSNGLRTAELINQKLNFSADSFKSSNLIHQADVDYKGKKSWGRNYSVGGATAYEGSGLASQLLMGKTGIYKQAVALVQQQVINENDLFFIEIGGNDLFALADARDDLNAQADIMNNAIENIKKCFYTLINNGAKKIIFASPPDILLTPRYNNKNTEKPYTEDDLNKIKLLCQEFDSKLSNLITKINKETNDVIKTYNLYSELKNILDEFKKTTPNANIENNLCTSTAFDLGSLDLTNIDINATVRKEYQVNNIDEFFFIDQVHPTAAGHKFVADKIWNLLSQLGLINI
ncbi:SGNH/GDSL hydrolase family protein [Spiroplasma tabanidicola]|uniref:Lipolytic enzyme n=1 Tax=Spiroplasma tabanidicola TaxID=324079 RepID=A0A6I6CJ39_9MOLU|nr:SGNH/GDSL hydrolase family protein [Spiroplasma tabanidicola]QGS52083.1 lipolytic enzyme [Spiroplasma tabanidicola]